MSGWLVLEPWITPSLWADWSANPTAGPVDEYKLCKVLGKDACLARLQAHWSTWLTEQDFKDIKTVGLNTVRIPIGYWAFQPNPDGFVNGQVAYLDKAIGWARSAGLKVWIDLHGAPGSQNGFDNSGLRDQTNWQYGNNVQITLDVLSQIAQKYAKPAYQDVVVAIELLNEPGPNLNMDQLGRFYMDGFGKVREVSDTFVTFSDAFKPPNSWNGLLSGPGNNVIVDHHRYQMFSEAEVTRALNTQISVACNAGSETSGSDKYVVIGEWSGAMTDCARWLNGFGRYSRYEGKHQNSRWYGNCSTKGDLDTMDWAKRQEIRKYIEAQLDTYEKTTNGWIFWTWKAEEGNMSDDWNYSKLVFLASHTELRSSYRRGIPRHALYLDLLNSSIKSITMAGRHLVRITGRAIALPTCTIPVRARTWSQIRTFVEGSSDVSGQPIIEAAFDAATDPTASAKQSDAIPSPEGPGVTQASVWGITTEKLKSSQVQVPPVPKEDSAKNTAGVW
ncbi:Glucan 1,3-beta-glucosidase [Drechslerella dactyloides]|uniref:glucan 1,3-beta-glucosidase n=1 Tax=Drechslerella dactyloides TaxID=74499 RepID=A0AAD6J5D9_DREDA|nr:Glucan 1,3-beta-glucosidase [Drechslerella dactyloides]